MSLASSGTPGAVSAQRASVPPAWCPVWVAIVAEPLHGGSKTSTGLAAGPSDPESPPTPKNRNLPFHGLGSCSSNCAEPSGAPKPVVFTVPNTWQRFGLAALGLAETMVTLATPSPASAAVLQLVAFAGAGPVKRPANG